MTDDDRPLTIPAALGRAARRHGNRPAYSDGGGGHQRTVTWGELHARAADFAAGLVALGLQKGDRVAICAENSVDWITALHGIVLAGGVAVPIYPELKAQEIGEQVRRPECRFVVTSDEALARIPERSPGLSTIIVIGESKREPRAGFLRRHPAETKTFDETLAAGTPESRAALPARAPAPDDLAAVIFTSGTTGGAKGVKLSHRNLLANGHSVLGAIDLDADDTVLLVLPLHHAMPFLAAVILPGLVGARVVMESDIRRVRDRMLEARPTLFFGVPALYDIMYRNVMSRAHAEGRLETLEAWQRRVIAVKNRTGVNIGPILFRQVHAALGGRLRFMMSGGAALSPATARSFFSLGLPLLQGWGLTESSPVISIQRFAARRFRLSRYYEEHVGSVGTPVPGVEVRLIDVPEKDIRVGINGEGEVIARGENIFQGYWEAEEQTRAAKIGEWLRTGDVGRIDANGEIYLTGRSKYIIVLDSGEKVHPDELEEKMAESPLVQDICVLGRKARDKVQVAVIVYPSLEATSLRCGKDGLDVTEENVRRLLSAEIERLSKDLAAYKRVSQIQITDQPLPKTPLQKVAREQLHDDYTFSIKRWRETAADVAI